MEVQFVVCAQCGQEFEFSADDQLRYALRGFDAPRRCPACRKRKSRDSFAGSGRRHDAKKRDYRMKYDER